MKTLLEVAYEMGRASEPASWDLEKLISNGTSLIFHEGKSRRDLRADRRGALPQGNMPDGGNALQVHSNALAVRRSQ